MPTAVPRLLQTGGQHRPQLFLSRLHSTFQSRGGVSAEGAQQPGGHAHLERSSVPQPGSSNILCFALSELDRRLILLEGIIRYRLP